MTPAIVHAFDELAADVERAREFEELLTERLLANVRTMKHRVGNGLSNPEILTAVAWCNLTTRSVFHRLYEKEERRLDEATGRITHLERELTQGDDSGPEPEEFRRFRESRIRFDRQTTEKNLRAQQVVDLKHSIGLVLDKFDISGLEAGDIEEALELVEEVDEESGDARVLEGRAAPRPGRRRALRRRRRPSATRARRALALAARELGALGGAQDRRGGRGSDLRDGPDPVAGRGPSGQGRARDGGPPAGGGTGAAPEAIKSARATLSRAARLDSELAEIVEEAQQSRVSEEARWYTRTRFRLVRATADLWLMLDNLQARAPPAAR